MRDNIYTEISINIPKKENDTLDEMLEIARDILKKLGGHKRDELRCYASEEYPYMIHHSHSELEPIWGLTFVTKNIKDRHKKIFKKLQQQFPDRNIYCPNKEDGWRLLLTRLAKCAFIVRNFTNDINIQRLNEEEKKLFQKIKEKYKFVFNSKVNDIRRPIQKIIRKKGMSVAIKKFDITFYLKKLENNPEINTSKVQKAINNIIEILNTELFISQFEWVYKNINELWKQEFSWYLFRKNDVIDSLKIPKNDREFENQVQSLYKILIETLNNKDLKEGLKSLGMKNTELKNPEGKMKKSIDLLELWIKKKLQKDNLNIIKFLRLLHNLRGKISHIFKMDELSKEEAFKEIVNFCNEKHPIKHLYKRSEVFKSILKTSEILLDDII